MKSLFYLAALLASIPEAAAAVAPVCSPLAQQTLSACSTGSAFCSSLLGYTTGGAYTLTQTDKITSTKTTTEAKAGQSTFYVTTTIVVSTTTYRTTVTQTAPVTTATVPSGLNGSPTCYVSTIAESERGAVPNRVNMVAATTAPTSCGFKSASFKAVSAACSCYVDTKTTVSTTVYKTTRLTATGAPTVTLTSYSTAKTTMTSTIINAESTSTVYLPAFPTPESSCGNAGVQWAYYPSLQECTSCSNAGCSTGPYNPGYVGVFDPSLYKTMTPAINGTSKIISIAYSYNGGGTGPFYGVGDEPLSYYVVNHRGYFYAPQTGNYSISFNYVDDAGFVWIGHEAYSGWDLSNYDYYEYYATPQYTLTVPFTAGMYVPIRVAFGQGCGAGGFGVVIVAPDGETMMQSSNGLTASPYFVGFSCDGTAPAYQPFGQET